MAKKGPLEERFWAKVDKKSEEECWLWTASLRDGQYGSIKVDGKTEFAHRASWFLHHGTWPDGLLLHKCDTPLCVNPHHLSVGSHQDNVDDMFRKGRENKAFGFALPHTKLTEEQVLNIRSSSENQYKLAEKYGVGQGTISRIKSGIRRYLVKEKYEEATC